MYLTGSRALDYYLGRTGSKSDWDIIAEEYDVNYWGLSFEGKDSIKYGDVEFISADCLNNRELYNEFKTDIKVSCDSLGTYLTVASPECLYITKRSHVWRPIKFSKHIRELQLIKDFLGEVLEWPITSHGEVLLKERTKLTREKYGHRAPSLNKSNEEFFDDFVTKYYIHDDLHKVVAYYDEPIYERLKNDSSLAKCEKYLWNQLSHEDKIKCVREECYVIALERFVIPRIENGERYPPAKITFPKSLEKVATTLTSGWFRDFAIDNFFEIMNYDLDFYQRFQNAVSLGKLKKII